MYAELPGSVVGNTWYREAWRLVTTMIALLPYHATACRQTLSSYTCLRVEEASLFTDTWVILENF
jgi:hypothetical protein